MIIYQYAFGRLPQAPMPGTCWDWLRNSDQSQVQPARSKRQQLQRAASDIQYICLYPRGSLLFQMANSY